VSVFGLYNDFFKYFVLLPAMEPYPVEVFPGGFLKRKLVTKGHFDQNGNLEMLNII
jgi:hypothetical protein